MAYTPTRKYLEDMAAREEVGQPLTNWLLFEIDCGLAPRCAEWLGAALEGMCGIPSANRDNPRLHPEDSARELVREALADMARWWSLELRGKREADCVDIEINFILGKWCTYRVARRAKEKTAAALAQVTTADQLKAA